MSLLLSVTFACGLLISVAHVINRRFVAPVYDVILNLTAFASAVAASLLLGHWIPALLSAVAVVCWLGLARRTLTAQRQIQTLKRNENRVVRLPAIIVGNSRKRASDLHKRGSRAVGSRWSKTGSA